MPQDRVDVEGLLAIPRMIFDSVSDTYGVGSEEVTFPCTRIFSPKQPPYHVRPLAGLPHLNGHYGLPSLVFWERIYPNRQEYSAVLEVIAGVPKSDEDLSMGNLSRPRRLLRVRVTKNYVENGSSLHHDEWTLAAKAEFGQLDHDFSFLGYAKFWPLVSDVLNQFAEAAIPFDGHYRYTKEKVCSHA